MTRKVQLTCHVCTTQSNVHLTCHTIHLLTPKPLTLLDMLLIPTELLTLAGLNYMLMLVCSAKCNTSFQNLSVPRHILYIAFEFFNAE